MIKLFKKNKKRIINEINYPFKIEGDYTYGSLRILLKAVVSMELIRIRILPQGLKVVLANFMNLPFKVIESNGEFLFEGAKIAKDESVFFNLINISEIEEWLVYGDTNPLVGMEYIIIEVDVPDLPRDAQRRTVKIPVHVFLS